jgi:hypothetical protein
MEEIGKCSTYMKGTTSAEKLMARSRIMLLYILCMEMTWIQLAF